MPLLRRLAPATVAACATFVALGLPAAAQGRSVVAAVVSPAAKTSAPKPVVLRLRYTVVAGDSLSRIARRHGVKLATLLRVNGLRASSVLRPGRVLRIPDITIPGILAAKLPRALLRRPERVRFVPLFQAASREFGVPPDLLMALAYRESNWDPAARSRSGAMGVGQLMPTTVDFVSTRLLRLPRPLDPWVAVDNIRMSARTLRHLLDLAKGDPVIALAAYYQGFGSVTRQGVLPIGRRYALSIAALRPLFQA